jgi:hypothetical protein
MYHNLPKILYTLGLLYIRFKIRLEMKAMKNSDHKISSSIEKPGALRIVKVDGRKALNEFIRVPWPLYDDDMMWVPPLVIERRMHFSPKNPFFEHAVCGFWTAYRDNRAVGRISAQIDQLHIDRYKNATGFFGLLEAEDNPATFKALLDTAETWLRNQGMRRISGPFNLSINQELGLLVNGFDTPPSLMMGHARPYYGDRIEENGYRKEKDLLAYIIDADFKQSAAMKRLTSKAKDRVHIRSLRKSHLNEEVEIIKDIFNDAWSQNWGFVPFTSKEFEQMGKDMKLLVNEDLVKIILVDGQPAAFIVVLPNVNEVIRDLDGRLLPFGWLKILWRLKIKYPKSTRIPLMGVRRRFQNRMLGAALAFMLIGSLREHRLKLGVEKVELSWILEDNMRMRNIIESIGGRVYKTYRIYEKELN